VRDELFGLLSGPCEIVVEFAGVTFVDSTGLGVLVAALKRARADGGNVRLVGARPHMLRVLELTGLDLRTPLP
jgi:anti-sigma B factor antagonist